MLAKALEGKNVKDLLSNIGAGGGAPVGGAPAAVAASGGAAAAEAPKEEEKKEEVKEESDDDMVRYQPSSGNYVYVSDMSRLTGFRSLRLISSLLSLSSSLACFYICTAYFSPSPSSSRCILILYIALQNISH